MAFPPSAWQPYDLPPDITAAGYLVGTSGYYFDDWIGLFNPPKSWRPRCEEERSWCDRLVFYQRYFSFVEINTTFYQEPSTQQFVDIERRSKQSMQYAVKVFRDISHSGEYDVQRGVELMKAQVASASLLAETGRFYSFLIQLEDHLQRSQKRLDYLLAVGAEAVRKGMDVHIEFRHVSWHIEHVLQSLKDAGIGICNTEIPPVRHAFPLKSYATSGKGYVRYSGRNLAAWYPLRAARALAKDRLASRNARYDYLYSSEELDARVALQETLRSKVSKVAVAFNNHFQSKAVLNAIDNINKLKQRLSSHDS